MKRSLKTLAAGLLLGFLLGMGVKLLLPGAYPYFISLLEQKTSVGAAVVGSYSAAILLNNSLASFLCSYGGYLTTRAFMLLRTPSSPWPRKLSILDGRVSSLRGEALKYYLSLHALPFFILGFTGFLLGSVFVFYLSNPMEYFLGLLPHGLFELPAILLAGSIGYTIAEAVFHQDFEAELKHRAKKEMPRFLLVLGLIAVGAYLEA